MEVHASPSKKQMSKFQDRVTRLLETKSFKAKMHKRMGTVRQAPFETSRRIKTQEQRQSPYKRRQFGSSYAYRKLKSIDHMNWVGLPGSITGLSEDMHREWLEEEFENIGTLKAMESEQERALESCRVDEENF